MVDAMDSDYSVRFWTMWYLCGPGSWKYLFSTAADVENAKLVLGQYKESPDISGKALSSVLEAERLSASVLHPDTGEPIPLPFRMAAHVPVNSLLLCAMLSARTVRGTALAQWANQSFNALQFYANRNSSSGSEISVEVIFASYLGAVTSAVAVAAGLQAAAVRFQARAPLGKGMLQACVPFLGAAAGKPLQIGLMRQDEWRHGVVVTDAAGAPQGVSVAAGQRAVMLTIMTRTLYLAPMLWMPYVQLALERAVPVLSRHRPAALASLIVHSAMNSALVTPACIALFDQRTCMEAVHLEEEFHRKGINTYFFNKGL